MIKTTTTITNKLGLHARASAAFAREAARFDAKVTVRYDGMSASAASIMDLLMLGARQLEDAGYHAAVYTGPDKHLEVL